MAKKIRKVGGVWTMRYDNDIGIADLYRGQDRVIRGAVWGSMHVRDLVRAAREGYAMRKKRKSVQRKAR